MDISKQFQKLVGPTSKMASLNGANILDPNFKITAVTRFQVVLILFYLINTLYTIAYFWPQFEIYVQCVCVLGYGVQGIVKLWTALEHSKLLPSLVTFLESIYKDNQKADQKRFSIFVDFLRKVTFVLNFGKFLFLSCFIVFVSYPIFRYVFFGVLEYTVLIIVPFVDHESTHGYFITVFSHYLYTFTGFSGNTAADLLFGDIVGHIVLLVNLFDNSLSEIGEMLKTNSGHSKDEILERLRNCLMMHQDITSYIEVINHVYEKTIFTQVTACTMSLSLALMCIVVTDWYTSYAFIVISAAQLLIYCALGTVSEVMNDKMMAHIYEFPWYLLSVKDQKLILMALLRCQNARRMEIVGFAPLNVSTGADLLKTIYSYFMMMLNFVA